MALTHTSKTKEAKIADVRSLCRLSSRSRRRGCRERAVANIIIKVKGGKGTISNNKEPGGCVTSTCKLILGKGEKLTLKAKPDHGYVFKRWDGPCVSTHGFKCKIKGSNGKERFVVHFGKA